MTSSRLRCVVGCVLWAAAVLGNSLTPALGQDGSSSRHPLPERYDADTVRQMVQEAEERGDATRGARLFADTRLACLSCHRVGEAGGTIGPELTAIAKERTPEQIVASVIWPAHEVDSKYRQISVATEDGRVYQGILAEESARFLVLLQHTADGPQQVRIDIDSIVARKSGGTVMPDRLMDQLDDAARRDLFRFLFSLNSPEAAKRPAIAAALRSGMPHRVVEFPFESAPLDKRLWPSWKAPINRLRVYDYYAKQAAYFRNLRPRPHLIPEFPGLEGKDASHWGTQDEDTWRDARWSRLDVGSVLCGVLRGGKRVIPRAVCVRLRTDEPWAACFDPETLTYPLVWKGGFVEISDVRRGYLGGLRVHGTIVARDQGQRPTEPYQYLGFYRHGDRILFKYRIGDRVYLHAPTVEDGRFLRIVAPIEQHPWRALTRGGPRRWNRMLQTPIHLGKGKPFAIDTIEPPFDNPWKSLLFFGDHDIAPDGSAYLCTMTGDVWRVSGFAEQDGRFPRSATWQRVASGLHQALGIVADGDGVFVLGRDQITRLHDLNGDGEADWYECFSQAYQTSPAGHDFICALERDAQGRFYIASGNQGVVRIDPAGRKAEVLATGFRNPDGLGLLGDRYVTVPCSEGPWTPASMICAVPLQGRLTSPDARIGGHQPPYFGYGGPKDDRAPDLPLVYLPRGLDNSSGAQVAIDSPHWQELAGQLIHTSYGAGRIFLLLWDEVRGQPQGAIVPIAGEFRSAIHRACFHPHDGHLYVSGMAGWGTYTTEDGCFQRVRWTDKKVPLPRKVHVHEDGVWIEFTRPVRKAAIADVSRQFAQCWNYRYSGAYGSPEFSSRHYGVPGHDVLTISSVEWLDHGRRLFVAMDDLQPVNQLHLSLELGQPRPLELFLTVHALDRPFHPRRAANEPRITAAHPILTDLAVNLHKKPNRWQKPIEGARAITMKTGPNLTYRQTEIRVRPGEPIRLTLRNPDVLPHNWVLARPGTLRTVGEAANRLIADPRAYALQYIPPSDDVLVHTDIVPPGGAFTVYFRAPKEPGRYPYLCTFPGHWMVMNGVLIVE